MSVYTTLPRKKVLVLLRLGLCARDNWSGIWDIHNSHAIGSVDQGVRVRGALIRYADPYPTEITLCVQVR